MSAPTPETVVLCAVCGQEWAKHIQLAYWRYLVTEEDDPPTDQQIEDSVGFLECIHLLKNANQGPQGPPGPIGMSGPQGEPG
jgi:hypothetical protein